MKAALFLASTAALFAQSGQPVNQSSGPPPAATQSLRYFSGSSLIYACTALSSQPGQPATLTVTAASNANPVSLTITAHGIGDYANLGATVNAILQISGGTGNWTAINGTFTATVTSANAVTIPVNSTAFGALTGTLVVTTTAPLLAAPVWAIQKFWWDGSSPANPIADAWLAKTSAHGSSTAYDKGCSSRASYAAQ